MADHKRSQAQAYSLLFISLFWIQNIEKKTLIYPQKENAIQSMYVTYVVISQIKLEYKLEI